MTNDQVLVSLKEKHCNSERHARQNFRVQNGSSGYDGFESQPDVLKNLLKTKHLFYMTALMKLS